MSNAEGPLLGILGGMGPLATAQFMIELAALAKVRRDQDHCRTIVYSDPGIPDRSDALVSGGPSPLPAMLAGIAILKTCRADAVAIPCNTAHFWIDQLSSYAGLPIISIVEAVIADLSQCGIRTGPIGLLGTPGLIGSQIYQKSLAAGGYRALTPDADQIATSVEPAIRAVKAGDIVKARTSLRPTVESLISQGAVALVLGCTELPFAMEVEFFETGFTVVDSNRSLARACLSWIASAADQASSQATIGPKVRAGRTI